MIPIGADIKHKKSTPKAKLEHVSLVPTCFVVESEVGYLFLSSLLFLFSFTSHLSPSCFPKLSLHSSLFLCLSHLSPLSLLV